MFMLCVSYVVGSLYNYAVVLRPCGDGLATVRAVLVLLSALLATDLLNKQKLILAWWWRALLLGCFLPLCVSYVVRSLYNYAVVLRTCGDGLATVRAVLVLLSALLATDILNQQKLLSAWWRRALLLGCFLPLCVTYVVGSLYNYAVVLRPRGDGLATVRAVLVLLSAMLAIDKFGWIAAYRRDICRVLGGARALGPAPMPAWSWRLSTLLASGLVISACNRLLLPLMMWKRVLPEENILLPGLENIEASPDYELTYFMNAFAFLTILPALVSFYLLFIGLTGHLDSHYRLLSAKFFGLVDRSTVNDVSSLTNIPKTTGSLDNKKLSKNLKKLIQQHCRIIAVTKTVKHLFDAMLGHDFGLLTLGIGLLLIQTNKSGVWALIDYFVYFFGNLLAICLTGESVCTAAEVLSTSVWCSGWEQFSVGERRSMLMVLRTSQQPQYLRAATFVMITYQTLMVILKTCFSIYTTFSAVRE